MYVRDLMTRNPATCSPRDSLNRAAQLMWDGDHGVVPVVDETGRVLGMITDRDVCMSAYMTGQPLGAIPVADAMSKSLFTCAPDDTLEAVRSILEKQTVRRLPVVNRSGELVGVLSLSDIAREAARKSADGKEGLSRADVATTLAAICRPRKSVVAEDSAALLPSRTGKPVAVTAQRGTVTTG